MGTLVERSKAVGVTKVTEFMRKQRLTLADLTEYGGEDFADPSRAKMAHSVDKCWALMAQLGLV